MNLVPSFWKLYWNKVYLTDFIFIVLVNPIWQIILSATQFYFWSFPLEVTFVIECQEVNILLLGTNKNISHERWLLMFALAVLDARNVNVFLDNYNF